MRSLIVTAGNGDTHRRWAKRIEQHINTMSSGGIRCFDFSDLVPWGDLEWPHHCKYHIWPNIGSEYNRIIWVDTDTFMTRPIMEDEIPDVPFAAVRDNWARVGQGSAKHLRADRAVFRSYPRYFNSGFMVCRRDAIPVFDMAFSLRHTMFQRSKLRDQDHFNYAVWKTLGRWHELDQKYNVQQPEKADGDAVVLHYCGKQKNLKQFEDLYEGART